MILATHPVKTVVNSPQVQWLDKGRRLHLQHGPIDLIIESTGDTDSVQCSYHQAIDAFQSVLPDLVEELGFLRTPLRIDSARPLGVVARKMYAASMPHVDDNIRRSIDKSFVTPMIAVAGSVADHILQMMLVGLSLDRAYVNNGGNIALFLNDHKFFDIGICENPETGVIASTARIAATDGIGGIATSGWRGRSHSMGVADAVTVLAGSAASADVAATIIANNVDVPDSSSVVRMAASELSPDSDLGDIPVTVSVENLDDVELHLALQNGQRCAEDMLAEGLIRAAFISVQGESIVMGLPVSNSTGIRQSPTTNQNLLGATHA